MRALLYETFGEPEVLHTAECPMPEMGPLDVTVRVRAATVGVGDCKARAGLLRPFLELKLPKIPGRYGVGAIAAVGPAVERVRVGDAVVFATLHGEGGSSAEYVRVPAESTAAAPPTLSDVETAS